MVKFSTIFSLNSARDEMYGELGSRLPEKDRGINPRSHIT